MPFRTIAVLSAFIVLMSQAEAQTYSEVSIALGLVPNHEDSLTCVGRILPLESGSAWGDYDNDGDSDLFLTNGDGPSRFYRNDGDTNLDGLPDFVEIGVSLGLDDPGHVGQSAVFIDYDNDSDQDLFVTKWGLNTMYQNQLTETGTATFTDVTPQTGLDDASRTITSAWGDFDQDGLLDVYLAKHMYCDDDPRNDDQLFRNNGDGSFTDVTSYLCPGGVPCAKVLGAGFSAGWMDYDNDGDPDLYVANEFPQTVSYPNILWRNDGSDGSGGWIFTDVSTASGTGQGIKSMGLGLGDIDNNGFFDIAVSNVGPNLLLKANGDGTYEDISASAGIERTWIIKNQIMSITWGTAFFDYNNDRLQDLLYSAGPIGRGMMQPNAFFENNGDLTFTDVSVASGLDFASRARAVSQVDLDKDGFVDVFIGQIGFRPLLFHNQGSSQGNTNHWLTVTVEGTTSNRDGIGARVTLATSDGVTQMREITSGASYGSGDERAARFGLGTYTEGELVVRWPSGQIDSIGIVSADQVLHLVEGGSGIPCDKIDFFNAKCNSNGAAQAMVRLLNSTEYAGQTVEFTIDGQAYPVVLITNGTHTIGKLQVPGAGVGAHTVTLQTPGGCYNPVNIVCQVGRYHTDEFDRIWAESESWNSSEVPSATALIGNYPNPFNPSTTIRYTLREETHVVLRLYNTLGQVVATLVDETQPAGEKAAVWSGLTEAGSQVSAGVYFYTLSAGDVVMTAKMLLVK